MSPRVAIAVLAWLLTLSSVTPAVAARPQRGHLLVIGGGLRPDNARLFSRLVAYAGGPDQARFGLLTMASRRVESAVQLSQTLRELGVGEARVRIIDLTLENAATNAFDPRVVESIRECTGLFFMGGDQRRIINSLIDPDGKERPALSAIRGVLARGGVIAGSSAGAAVQGNPMLTVSGLPDDLLDEGMDALDFGLTTGTRRRGVGVTRGLGFFSAGLIDQHFHQFRGRLSRMARTAVEKGIRYGFGVDENTAMDVFPDGTIEVVGSACVTVVDTKSATCDDGPLGCVLSGVNLSLLEEGDRFDPKTGQAVPAAGKRLIAPGTEANNGNFLIPDIAGEGAVYAALVMGLGDNTCRRQAGVTLRYTGSHGHGYRFTFSKTDQTRTYAGYVHRAWCNSVLGVRLDIEPILSNLQPPRMALPEDLPPGRARHACEAVWFRGILPADDTRRFRPDDVIRRGELAVALARSIHLEIPRRNPPAIADVPETSPLAEDVVKVVSSGFLSLDRTGAFHPDAPIARSDAAATFVRAWEAYHGEQLPAGADPPGGLEGLDASGRSVVAAAIHHGLLAADQGGVRPAASLTRAEAAEAICRILELSGSRPVPPAGSP